MRLFLYLMEELYLNSGHDLHGLFIKAFTIAKDISCDPLLSHRNRVDSIKHTVSALSDKRNKVGEIYPGLIKDGDFSIMIMKPLNLFIGQQMKGVQKDL